MCVCAADILTFAEEGCRYFDVCRGGVFVCAPQIY